MTTHSGDLQPVKRKYLRNQGQLLCAEVCILFLGKEWGLNISFLSVGISLQSFEGYLYTGKILTLKEVMEV